VVRQSILTGFLVSLGFLVVGNSVFAFLGISVSDFKVAGGILLFILAVVDLIFPEKTEPSQRKLWVSYPLAFH